jgi:Leucine Rich repeat
LYLGNNCIPKEGVMAIADALQGNTTLTSLDLSEIDIQQEGAASLSLKR